jgi:hypothetical protein
VGAVGDPPDGGADAPAGGDATPAADARPADGDGGTGGADAAPPPAGLRIGIWLSPWVLGSRTPAEWVAGIKGLSNASSYPNRAIVVFGMCGAASETTSLCLFPPPAGVPAYPHIEYGADQVTPILDAIEADGAIDVIVDVEPMQAHVSDLMHVTMTALADYDCVVGFSPDWEWVTGDPEKVALLPGWKDELHGYRPGAELHLISWMEDSFGDYRDPALSFGCDSQGFGGGLAGQLAEFTAWSQHFAPDRSGWYWGYASDAEWTRPLVGSAEEVRALQDQYRDIDPEGTILMATESLYFEIDGLLPAEPMW